MDVLIGTDDGFHALGSGRARQPQAHAMNAVAAGPGGLWAISGYQHLWRHPTGGEGGIVAKTDGWRANCLLIDGDSVLVGASEADLYRLDGESLERIPSFDEVPGRDGWYTPWGGPPDVRSLASGPDGTLYVNVHVGGVVVSTDGGVTWRDTMDIDADVHEVSAHPADAGHAYAASARGLGVTADGGGRWRFDRDGLHGAYCRAVALSDEMVFLSASLGSGGRQAAVYRRPIGAGGAFDRCTAGLPEWFSDNLNTFCLAARGRFVAAGDADGTVYVSEDDGATWQVAVSGLPGVRCLTIL